MHLCSQQRRAESHKHFSQDQDVPVFPDGSLRARVEVQLCTFRRGASAFGHHQPAAAAVAIKSDSGGVTETIGPPSCAAQSKGPYGSGSAGQACSSSEETADATNCAAAAAAATSTSAASASSAAVAAAIAASTAAASAAAAGNLGAPAAEQDVDTGLAAAACTCQYHFWLLRPIEGAPALPSCDTASVRRLR